MSDVQAEDVGKIIARLKVFTEPISVFTDEDNLTVSACHIKGDKVIYVLVSSTQFSLLYRVDMTIRAKQNMEITFEQIVTIKSAT